MTTMAKRGAMLSVFTALAAAVAVLVSAATAPAAAPAKERVGGRINVILGTPTEFPAGDPFHISHGWGPESGISDADAIGRYRFELEVDGVRRAEDFVERSVVPGTGGAPDRHTLFWHSTSRREWPARTRSPGTGTRRAPPTGIRHATRPRRLSKPSRERLPSSSYGSILPWVSWPRHRPSTRGIPSAASLAVDGNWWTYWNSGNFPPQWIEVDLDAVHTVGEIRLGITQLPDSPTTHSVFGRSSTSEPWTLLHTFDGYTVDQQVLTYVAPTPLELRFIRVETTSSWSWVAWREVEVYSPSS